MGDIQGSVTLAIMNHAVMTQLPLVRDGFPGAGVYASVETDAS